MSLWRKRRRLREALVPILKLERLADEALQRAYSRYLDAGDVTRPLAIDGLQDALSMQRACNEQLGVLVKLVDADEGESISFNEVETAAGRGMLQGTRGKQLAEFERIVKAEAERRAEVAS